MEATDARRAFPCFDEPAFKATFAVTLMIDAGDTAISNGKQVSDTPGPEPGKHTIVFAPTPKMSSYLVALLVGDFVCRSGAAGATPIRVCATPDKQSLTAFALTAAEHEVTFFNDYFRIPYPYEKLDIIGVPDFAAGAMENAGAITFRERMLLADERTASVAIRKSVASVIAHELAHQWFGDLVTMKWWDDIWLNEGFATWMEKKAVAAWQPAWRVDLDETVDTVRALALDSLQSTRSIRMRVETPEEINQVFDGIAYEKTAAVLRMIEMYVGPDAFRKGIASYLKRSSWSNAAGEDFWEEVTRVTGKPVNRIMRSFVDQIGAPVLSVRNKCVQNTTSEIAVGIERFIQTPGASSKPQTWTLPVCYRSIGGQARCELLESREQTVRANGCGPVVMNADSRGYYFTDYAAEAVRALAANTAGLKPVERLSLIGDEWRMARAGRHDIDVYLDLAGSLAKDETPAVIDDVAEKLSTIGADIADPSERPRYEAWIRTRFAPVLAALGLPGRPTDEESIQARRATLLTLLGVTGNDPDVQRRARELAERYVMDTHSLSGTLAPSVLAVAAHTGDAALYQKYMAKMQTLQAEPDLYYRFFNTLTWFKDPALVTRTLEFAMSPDVRSQDTGTLIGVLLTQPWSGNIAWTFTQAQWPALVKKLGVFQGIPSITESLGAFCSASHASGVKAFFAKNPVPAVDRSVQQAIERIESCVRLDARQSKPFAAWLAGTS
jgi:aminopeptidase N